MRAPFRRGDIPLQGRHGPSVGAERRAVRAADLGQGRRTRLSGHAHHWWALSRGLRGGGGGLRIGGRICHRRPGVLGAELLLPISYVFETPGFRAQRLLRCWSASDRGCTRAASGTDLCLLPQHRRPTSTARGARCMNSGTGRAPAYQGEVVDRLLPGDRRWQFDWRRAPGASRALVGRSTTEVTAVGGAPWSAQASGDRTTGASRGPLQELRARFAARHLVEVGIGCEACHGGSREHVDDPRVLPDFAPRSAFLADARRGRGAGGDAGRTGQPRLRPMPPGAVLALPVHLGRRAASRRQPGRQLDHLRRGARSAAGRLRAPDVLRRPATIRTAKIDARSWNGWARWPATRVCVRLPRAVRRAGGAGRARAPRSEWRGGELHRLPHAAQEHGARLRAHPLSPHRLARRSGARRARSPAGVRALPCRQDRRGAGRRPWSAGGGARYDRAALAVLYGASTCGRFRRRSNARQGARAGGGAGDAGRGADATAAVPAVARQLVNPFPLVRYYARRALEALRGPCAVDLDRRVRDRGCRPQLRSRGVRGRGGRAHGPAPAAPARGGNDVDED